MGWLAGNTARTILEKSSLISAMGMSSRQARQAGRVQQDHKFKTCDPVGLHTAALLFCLTRPRQMSVRVSTRAAVTVCSASSSITTRQLSKQNTRGKKFVCLPAVHVHSYCCPAVQEDSMLLVGTSEVMFSVVPATGIQPNIIHTL